MLNHHLKNKRFLSLGWLKLPIWIYKIAVAAIISLSIHLSFVFIIRGTILKGFDITDGLELPFTFLYFLALFWIYPWISQMVHAPALAQIKKGYVKFVEGFTVVASTVILSLVLKVLPLWLAILYINSIQDDLNLAFSPDQLRRSFIIYAIIGLFFYYFVERQRIRKQLQVQQLKHTELQKEKFRARLQNLKAQVNPDFLFNSLNFLDDLIQEKPNEAEEFVSRLSNVYRSFLKRDNELIPLQDEMTYVEDYLYIINHRFKNNITFRFDIKSESKQKLILPQSLNILIENMTTGLKLKENAFLSIDFFTRGNKLVLTIDVDDSLQGFAHIDRCLKTTINERYKYFTDEKGILIKTATGITIELPLLDIRKDA